jgi:hypothetical protein
MKGLMIELLSLSIGRTTVSAAQFTADPSLHDARQASLIVTANAMDAFDGISVDKLKHLARTHPRLPIIVTCCSELYGRVSELLKVSVIFKAGPPSHMSLATYAERILAGEGLGVQHASKIAEHSSADFAQVASNIALNRKALMLGNTHSGLISKDVKDHRKDALSAVAQCLSGCSFGETVDVFMAEGGLFATLIAENYIDYAGTCPLDVLALCADDVSFGDVMETSMYSTQNWSLHDVWVCQAAVVPCCRLHLSGKPPHNTTTPRFSKLWSCCSSTSVRKAKLMQARSALSCVSASGGPDMDTGMAVGAMLWFMIQGGNKQGLRKFADQLGLSAEHVHNLARMAGKQAYKASHRKLVTGLWA